MKPTFYFIVFALLFSCGVTYQEVETIDCDKIIIGDWKIYKIEQTLEISSEPNDFKLWEFRNNGVKVEDSTLAYTIDDNCSKLILQLNQEKDLVFDIAIRSIDTLILEKRVFCHESRIEFVRMN